MIELQVDNLPVFLRDRGWLDRQDEVAVEWLSGGVSNVVYRVRRVGGEDLIVKQARPRLRVPAVWECGVERIWREVEVLRCCERLLRQLPAAGGGTASVPTVLHEDREQFVYVMTAAPPHQVWKQQLLAGELHHATTELCAAMLAQLHGGSWRDAALQEQLRDRQYFEALRIDPYFRFVAANDPQWRSPLHEVIDLLDSHSLALVHGDFSPKNLLVHDRGVVLIDCEVGHFGDPAFDVGFVMSHLLLKACALPAQRRKLFETLTVFYLTYEARMQQLIDCPAVADLTRRSIRCLGGLMIARVHGKSRVEYLDPAQQQLACDCGQALLTGNAATWLDARGLWEHFVPWDGMV